MSAHIHDSGPSARVGLAIGGKEGGVMDWNWVAAVFASAGVAYSVGRVIRGIDRIASALEDIAEQGYEDEPVDEPEQEEATQ